MTATGITPHGTARLRMRGDARHGILDHDFVDPPAGWTMEFMITFFTRHWERGARQPEGPARASLPVIGPAPKAVQKALQAA